LNADDHAEAALLDLMTDIFCHDSSHSCFAVNQPSSSSVQSLSGEVFDTTYVCSVALLLLSAAADVC